MFSGTARSKSPFLKQKTDENVELVDMYSSVYISFSQHWFRFRSVGLSTVHGGSIV